MKTTHFVIECHNWETGANVTETVQGANLEKALNRLDYIAKREGAIKLDDGFTVRGSMGREMRRKGVRSVSTTIFCGGCLSVQRMPWHTMYN